MSNLIVDIVTKRDSKTGRQAIASGTPKDDVKLPELQSPIEEKKVTSKQDYNVEPKIKPKVETKIEQKLDKKKIHNEDERKIEIKEEQNKEESQSEDHQDKRAEMKAPQIRVEPIEPPHAKDVSNMVVIVEDKDEQK